MKQQRFAYGAKKRMALPMLIVGLVMTFGPAILTHSAPRLPKSPGGFIWLAMALCGAALTYLAFKPTLEVVVTPTLISAPRGEFSRTIVHINPAHIRDITHYRLGATAITFKSGKVESGKVKSGKVLLLDHYFRSKGEYRACIAAIEDVTAKAQHPRVVR